MPGIVETLRELHRLHRHIRELKDQTEAGPRLLKQQQLRLQRAETALADAKKHIQTLRASVLEKESALKATHAQIGKYEKQRETAGSKKEYDALETEIKHAREQCQKLEDESLTVLAEIDEKVAETPALEKTLAQAKTETAGFETEEQRRQQVLAIELDRALGELNAVEAAIPSDIRVAYNRLIASYGADGLASAVDKICSSCYGSLTMQNMRDLENGRFLTCTRCGRALYL